MAVFYHLSISLAHDGLFEPRIPINRVVGSEDSTRKRVCVSPTIEGCFTALGSGSNRAETNFERRGYYMLFRIDTKKLGIDDRHIMSDQELYQKGLVPDAQITKEHWITTSFNVPKEDMQAIQIVSFEEIQSNAYPYDAVQVANEKYKGDVDSAYKEIYAEPRPVVIEVVKVDYLTTEGKKGERRFLFVNDESEQEVMKKFIEKHINARVEGWEKDRLYYRLLGDVDLKILFIKHLIVSWEHEKDEDVEMVAS